MKIVIKVGLSTDGDYSLQHAQKYNMEFDGNKYFHVYQFNDEGRYTFYPYEDTSYAMFDSWWRASRLLEHILCDIHVLYTHHYVLDYLYHMFDDAIKALHNREESHYGSIDGNYAGTYIEYFTVD